MDKDNLSKIAKLKQLKQNKENQSSQVNRPSNFNLYAYNLNNVDKSDENDSKKWNIKVSDVNYVDNCLQYKVDSIHYTKEYPDLPLLNKIAPDVFEIKHSREKKGVYLKVKEGKEQEFLNCLPEIQKTLEDLGTYYNQSIVKFIMRLGLGVKETPTQQEINDVHNSMVKSWKELLLMLKDPDVRKKFLLFQTTITCDEYFKGARLSPRNVIDILSQDPQATFVTDNFTWFTKFNRKVKDNARRLLITKAHTNVSKNALNQHKISQAHGGYNEVVKMSHGKNYGTAYSVRKDVANTSNPISNTYSRQVVYDVRDTEPLDPNNDPFLQIPNLINNLTGEMNAAALNFVAERNKENGVETETPRKIEGIVDDEKLLKFKDILLRKCKREGIKINDVGDTTEVIGECLYQYGLKVAESYNILVPKEQDIFASILCYVVCNTFNILCQRAKLSNEIVKTLTDEKAEMYASYVMETYVDICSIRLYESKKNKTFSLQDIKDLFKQFVNPSNALKEEFMRKFINLTERMNNVLK